MPDIRRCSIYGCRTNSREHPDLKFFNFPRPDSPHYSVWLSRCAESAEFILEQRWPYICSKHFHNKDIGYRRLATGALPALFLTAPPGFDEEERARRADMQAYAEKRRLVKLINDCVQEWSKRARYHLHTVALYKSRRELQRIGFKVRDLLGATLTVTLDDYWLRKFRRSHLVVLEHEDLEKSRNKTLNLESIIADIDPTAKILSEDEIAVLVKEEKARQAKAEAKRILAKAKEKAYEDSLVRSHNKQYKAKSKKNTSENSFADHSGHSCDNLRDDSMSSGCYQVTSECSENKSQGTDSIHLCLSDDDDIYAAINFDNSCNEADQSMDDEFIPVEIKSESRDWTELGVSDNADVDPTNTRNEIVPVQIKTETDVDPTNTRTEIPAIEIKSESNDREVDDASSTKEEEIVINSYQQALAILQPLEDYALRKEKYDALGLLLTLEAIFENPNKDA